MNKSICRCLSVILSLCLCAAAGLLCCAAVRGNGLTAPGARDMVLLLTGFAAGSVLLLLFVVQAFRDQYDPGILCAASAVFLFPAGLLSGQAPCEAVSVRLPEFLFSLCLPCSQVLLLLFLASRGGKARSVLWGLAVLHLCAGALAVTGDPASARSPLFSTQFLPAYTGLAGLAAALILGWLWRKERFFFRCFLFLTLLGAAGLILWDLLRSGDAGPLSAARQLDPIHLSIVLLLLMLAAAAIAAVAAFLRQESERQEEIRLLRVREESARASYEALRLHNEEIRMARHDMEKHFFALRRLAEGGSPQIARYLDELIEADKAIRPVVHSGSAMLNAILNHFLNKAMDRGVAVEILRDQAPDGIALSDTELCSLVMNVMDNALEAVSAPGLEAPFIHLDLYTKQAFFFLFCENARTGDPLPKKENALRSRGLGLKIIRQIAERNGGLVQIDPEPDLYRIRIALPVLSPDASRGERS